MKKIILLSLLLTGSYVFSQSAGTYNQIIAFLHQAHPEVSTENELIALCVWSSDNAGSRETTKAFKSVYDTYQGAILKDGRKGMILVCVSADKNEVTYAIALQKDGIRDCITYCDFKGPHEGLLKSLELGTATNVVYSGKGDLFFKDLDQTNVKSSITSLLTR